MSIPLATPAIPTVDRKVDSIPRRSATATWSPVSDLFSTILRDHPRASEVSAALNELRQILPPLFLHQAVRSIALRCGDVFSVVVVIRYADAEGAEHTEPPLALPPELAADVQLSLWIEIAAGHVLPQSVHEPTFIAGDLIPVFLTPTAESDDASPENRPTEKGDDSL